MEQADASAAPRATWLVVGAAAVLMGVVVRSAWVTEDAYITLRTVDNVVHGLGLRWNVAERVQGYTHPLWMFALSALYFVTREDFFTTIALSIATTGGAIAMLAKLARSGQHAFAAIALLALSKSFIDYSTSGLENPLSHLLIAAFVFMYTVRPGQLRSCAALVALAALNRTDSVLLLAPALLHAALTSFRVHGAKATARDLLIGFSPLLAWEAFSLFYYGFAFPNTAYAKLNTGIAQSELARQGFTYLLDTSAWDTPGMIALGLGLYLAFSSGQLQLRLLGLGSLLYLVYVVRVGGDFMIGRFITMPLFASACLLARSPVALERPALLSALLAPFAILFLQPNATERFPAGDLSRSGIADERVFFRDTSSLLMFTRNTRLPSHGWAEDGRDLRARKAKVVTAGNVGFRGFFAGPSVHIVDWHALTDPLLSRLPVRNDPNWRVGHYLREIPSGYVETLTRGKCVMADGNLCEYYAKLREVVSGELWSFSRLVTIVRLNLGSYDHLIDKQRYRFPGLVRAPIARVSAPLPDDARWDRPEARTFTADGIEVLLDKLSHAKRIELMLDGNDSYLVQLRRGTEVVADVHLPSRARGNLHRHHIETPRAAAAKGFDRLLIRAEAGDGFYSVAAIKLQ